LRGAAGQGKSRGRIGKGAEEKKEQGGEDFTRRKK